MKRILAGIAIGIVVSLPIGAFAWSSKQVAAPFMVAQCGTFDDGRQDPNDCNTMISRFQDGNNYCYIASANTTDKYNDPSISCTRSN